MRILSLVAVIAILTSCGSEAEKPFCVAECQKDTLKFIDETHELKPYIYISAKNCLPDSVIWSYSGLGTNRKLSFSDFSGTRFQLNKEKMNVVFKDTSFAWLIFNDCSNGRGYFAKIPFNKSDNIRRKSSAFTQFDPKYSIADGLVAYTDRGNLFVEEMATGKTAIMTFGRNLADIDYDAMHEFIDSVNITPTRIWANVLIDKTWTPIEKNITLELPKK